MRSSFFEFNVATSALFVARGGLDTVSHNVSNASTKGFTRQVVEQRATTPLTFNNGRGMIGTGAEIYGINQIRNFYLDKKYWSESGVLGEYSTKTTHLSAMEQVFNELPETGLNTQFNDFFSRLQVLSESAGEATYRGNLVELGNSMTTFFQNTYETLKKQQRDINSEVKVTVDRINSIGQQIKSLNKQIANYELDGSKANDLRDARASLVDDLSQYVNIEVNETETNLDYAAGMYPNPEDRGKSAKVFSVMINGNDFVKGDEINLLECRERKALDDAGKPVSLYYNPEDNAGLYDIYWKGSNSKFDMYHPDLSGNLRGLIDTRDGNNENYIANASTNSYDPATGKLVLDLPAGSRIDLSAGGGKISVFDPVTGRTTEYTYASYNYNTTTKKAEFTIVNPDVNDLFTKSGVQVSVGQTSEYKGIPYYMSRLNDLVRTFATAINEGRYMDGTQIEDVTGHLYGYGTKGDTGNLFYTYKDASGNEAKFDANYNIYNMTADNFYVNKDVLDNLDLLAASEIFETGKSDNSVILDFLTLKENDSLFKEGSLQDFIIGISVELGIDVKQAENFEKNYTDVTMNIDNQRLSVSGVDINEEMINMIKYQQQYQAAAKLINVIDGIYDTTINRLGV
jgi:flagellar hook-associated protein 1 FlgK